MKDKTIVMMPVELEIEVQLGGHWAIWRKIADDSNEWQQMDEGDEPSGAQAVTAAQAKLAEIVKQYGGKDE